ncbi:2-dehydropantoate 2-reductase [Cytobacillus suaedae]|nr:2-dehydropantoate 2-reductase [Cytobacillus suaedae]
MKVGIIGAGAIGLLFASYIAPTHNLTIYTRKLDQRERLNKEGLLLIRNGKKFNIKVSAEILQNQSIEQLDLLIIAVKQYHLHDLITQFPSINQATTIVFLQNGMGHIRYLDKLRNDSIYVGVVEHGAMLLSSHSVEHTGIGITKISSFKGSSTVISSIIASVGSSHFPFTFEEDWSQMLIEKLVINSVINPLTSLYGVKNGELLRNVYFYKLMKELFSEVTSVFPSENREVWDRVVEVCEKTSNNRSSMLKDLEEGRLTEIDAILGYVLEIGKRKEIDLPVINFLYHSIKGLEKRGD